MRDPNQRVPFSPWPSIQSFLDYVPCCREENLMQESKVEPTLGFYGRQPVSGGAGFEAAVQKIVSERLAVFAEVIIEELRARAAASWGSYTPAVQAVEKAIRQAAAVVSCQYAELGRGGSMIEFPPDIRRALDAAQRTLGVTPEQVVQVAVREFLCNRGLLADKAAADEASQGRFRGLPEMALMREEKS